ncbi:hypothetical protein EV426DRAFT_605260 [Tirmania nivea]|nr:hypothetical protein EV426DRAFT_605260 [Tirmania nivea]
MFRVHGHHHDQSEQWQHLYLRRAVLADMRHLTQFSMKYEGRTNIFANAAGYSIPPIHTGRIDLNPESKSAYDEITREIYLLELFREGDSHPATILSAIVFTTFNRAQCFPTLTEFTVNSTYKLHSASLAEKIMIITLREFVKRCRFTRNLSWADIGDFVRQFVRFGVQVDEPRIFQSMWKELMTSVDGLSPVLDYMPAGGSGLWASLSPLSFSISATSNDSSHDELENAFKTLSAPPLVRVTLPECRAVSAEEWDFRFLTDLKPRRHLDSVVRVEPLPTLEPQPIVLPRERLLRPDFGVGWLACGGSRDHSHRTITARLGKRCI